MAFAPWLKFDVNRNEEITDAVLPNIDFVVNGLLLCTRAGRFPSR